MFRGFIFIFILSVYLLSCKDKKAPPQSMNLSITDEYLDLETEYREMLEPVSNLKSDEPEIYWFIVSWLKTNYKTPDWTGYGKEGWQEQVKKRGIDCSGFARVMQEEIFDKKVRGGSKGIFNSYCKKISSSDMQMGDLVFF